ncbi:RND superfamily putative drug exporter [Actinomadura pelletieri DSM 43383]|uniref:RND superfamily putative drug exporter n=1 Tax=Actinomadura pelletieri DSM 43383 TaxID=1120940 RepID=A0A495QRN9_9ACTN|nr:MMPL family transporter [Actinomadura pelletieri]RKS76155.1 RND superfamily putative drug exporter [Actinomadura pelletieri DSM 43383]
MATLLYRLGRGAFRRRFPVALLWLAALAAAFLGSASAGEAPSDSFTMPGIESQKAFDHINEKFPGVAADGADARVVFIAPKGRRITAPENRAPVDALVTEVARGPQVADVESPFDAGTVSEDGSTAFATVTYKVTADDLTEAGKAALRDAVERARASGLTVEVGGSALETDPAGAVGEILGIAVAAVVLLVTFGSLAAAGLSLLTAVLGVGVSLMTITALQNVFDLSPSTAELSLMLGVAVAIDYALFVVSRYREERAAGHEPREAAGLAVGTAGTAVVFAGLTVVIALVGLAVVGVPMLTRMGMGAAGAVVVGVLVALTLVPALLGFLPNAVLARRTRKNRSRAEGRDALGARWARFVVRRPIPVLLVAVAALGATVLPSLNMRLGMPGDEAKPTSTSERRAYDALADAFGPGFNGPLTLVVDAGDAPDPKAAVSTIAGRIAATEGVVSVSVPRFDRTGTTAVLSATPSTAPTDQRTKDLVQDIRSGRPAIESAAGATFEVTGATALNIDVGAKMQRALIPYLATIVGLAFLLLLLVFRSVLVPLKAALGYLLSIGAALGALVTVFQNGHGAGIFGVDQPGPIMSILPIFLVGISFGLAMDYQVFLVSRMREAHVHGEAPGQAIVTGFRHSGRVVMAASLIMMAVFGGFMTGAGMMMKMVGFGLAAAVLFDAVIVRMVVVPAVLALLGGRAWWLPRRLDRLLPRVDVEGESLRDRVPSPAPVPDGARTPTARV